MVYLMVSYDILEWKIQFAVIYKGYKFFNREPEPDKLPEVAYTCPSFKAPQTNNLCLKAGMPSHFDYFKQLEVSFISMKKSLF